ncbi:hypothetical protein Hanom_Chr06g00565411 [Helianthus anomalus]
MFIIHYCVFDTKGKSKVVFGDETVSPKVKSKFDMDLDNILIPKNKFHVYPKGMSNAVVCAQEPSLKVVSEVVSMPLVKECIAYHIRLKVQKINDSMVIRVIRPTENIVVSPLVLM